MNSTRFSGVADAAAAYDGRYHNLAQTPNFRDGRYEMWSHAMLAVIGVGLLGFRVAEEAVVSGAQVLVFDPDIGELANLGTQRCRAGMPKAQTLVEQCDAIRPGRARAFACDVRHAGIRPLLECDLWLDCTDDPALAWPLTVLSNGLRKPLLRCAVDGSGQSELGRVLCSSGGTGHACQLCSYAVPDGLRRAHRTPCLGQHRDGRPPTLAGGAIGAGIAGLALSLSQRLVTGHDAESVLDHEFILDWTTYQFIRLRLPRSGRCLSGHQAWQWLDTDVSVHEGTLRDLFGAGQQQLSTAPQAIGVHFLPLNLQAYCSCGSVREAVGTARATAPLCPSCGRPMQWLEQTRIESVRLDQAYDLGLLDRSLDSLGIPAGALIAATAPDRSAVRMLLP